MNVCKRNQYVYGKGFLFLYCGFNIILCFNIKCLFLILQSMCICSFIKEFKVKKVRFENYFFGIYNQERDFFIGQREMEDKYWFGDQFEVLGFRTGQGYFLIKIVKFLMNLKRVVDIYIIQNLGESQRRLDMDILNFCGNVDIQISEKF